MPSLGLGTRIPNLMMVPEAFESAQWRATPALSPVESFEVSHDISSDILNSA